MLDKPSKPYNIPFEVFDLILSHLDKHQQSKLLPMAVASMFSQSSLFDTVVPRVYAEVSLKSSTIPSFLYGLDLATQQLPHKRTFKDRRAAAKKRLLGLLTRMKMRASITACDTHIVENHQPDLVPLNRKLHCLSFVKSLEINDAPSLDYSKSILKLARKAILEQQLSEQGGAVDYYNIFPQLETIHFGRRMLIIFAQYSVVSFGSSHPFLKFLKLVCRPSTLVLTCPQTDSPLNAAFELLCLPDRFILDSVDPVLQCWQIKHLKVFGHEGGILPTPAGAIVEVDCHIPCSPMMLRTRSLFGLTDISLSLLRLPSLVKGVALTLGYKGPWRIGTDAAVMEAASKVTEWRFPLHTAERASNASFSLMLLAAGMRGAELEKKELSDLDKGQQTGIRARWSEAKRNWVITYI